MNNRVSELYQAMLKEVQGQLKMAETLFLRMSDLVLELMHSEPLPEAKIRELRKLSQQHRELLSEIVRELSRIYPGRIELYPPEEEGFLKDLERRNAQSEELERIVRTLLNEHGNSKEKLLKDKENKRREKMENINFKAEFEQNFSEAEQFCKRPNILVAGYTGCGKTSLIRTVLGNEIVPAEGVDNSRPCRIEFDCYENEEIRLWDSRGLELGEKEADFREQMREFVAERQDDTNADEHIHLVWYLIQGNGARVTDCDLALLREIFTPDNVIAVLSKKDITRPAQAEAIRKVLQEEGIPAERIVEVSDAEGGGIGCRELVALSLRMLPAAYRDAFLAAQQIDREAKAAKLAEKNETARAIVNDAAQEAAQVAEVPVERSENSPLIPIGIAMAAHLASLYGLRERKLHDEAAEFVKSVFTASPETVPWYESSAVIGAETAHRLVETLGNWLHNNFEEYALAKI